MNTATTTPCIVCETPTQDGTPGLQSTTSGPLCDDCAYWCDGNIATG